MAGGRPTKYTKELGIEICHAVANSSNGLLVICEQHPEFPSARTIREWIFQDPEFSLLYEKAKQEQADYLADEIVAIADTPLIGEVIRQTKDGTFAETGDNVQRSRLKIDARKWVAAKLKPKKYGDKVDVTSAGEQIKSAPVFIVKDQSTADELKKLNE